MKAVVKHAQKMGYDVSDLIALANSKKPTDLENLPRIERAFKDCELMGKQLIMHQGKLLAKAQDIFYAHNPEGTADQLYGKWQRETLGINTKQAQRLVRYYRYCSENFQTDGHACPSLPSLRVMLVLSGDGFPEKVRDELNERIKQGETLTENIVRETRRLSRRKTPDPITAADLENFRNTEEYQTNFAEEKAAEDRAYNRTVSQLDKTISEYGTGFVQQRVDEKLKQCAIDDPMGKPDFTVEECRKVLQVLKHKPGWEDVQIRFQKQLELAKKVRGAA